MKTINEGWVKKKKKLALNIQQKSLIFKSKLSSQLGVSKEAIVIQIEKKAKQKARRETKDNFAKAATFNDDSLKKVNPERQQNLIAAKAEETLIASLLHNPDFYSKINSPFRALSNG